MLTAEKYRELTQKRDEAEHLMDYWDGNVESILEATRWIDDYENSGLKFSDMQEHKEDSDMALDISFAVTKLSRKAAERAEYWRKIYNDLEEEISEVEDELRREEQEEDGFVEYDEPDYGVSRGERMYNPCPFDFAAMGMGI